MIKIHKPGFATYYEHRTFGGYASDNVVMSPGLGESPSNTIPIFFESGVLEEAGLIETVMAV